MNSTRNGKIARLPKAIREELNQRLDQGETARSLVDWLNGLPEVQALVQSQFGGHPIREQNVSQWKKGGHQEWLRHQEAMELAERLYERAGEMHVKEKEEMNMSEVLSFWLAARYAAATEEIAAMEGPEAWKQLRQMCGDVAKLRRLDYQAQKMGIEEDRLELQREEVAIEQARWEEEKRERHEAAKAARRREEEEREPVLSNEERRRRIAEIYGRA